MNFDQELGRELVRNLVKQQMGPPTPQAAMAGYCMPSMPGCASMAPPMSAPMMMPQQQVMPAQMATLQQQQFPAAGNNGVMIQVASGNHGR